MIRMKSSGLWNHLGHKAIDWYGNRIFLNLHLKFGDGNRIPNGTVSNKSYQIVSPSLNAVFQTFLVAINTRFVSFQLPPQVHPSTLQQQLLPKYVQWKSQRNAWKSPTRRNAEHSGVKKLLNFPRASLTNVGTGLFRKKKRNYANETFPYWGYAEWKRSARKGKKERRSLGNAARNPGRSAINHVIRISVCNLKQIHNRSLFRMVLPSFVWLLFVRVKHIWLFQRTQRKLATEEMTA